MDKLVLVFSIFRSQSITLELDDREFFAVEGDKEIGCRSGRGSSDSCLKRGRGNPAKSSRASESLEIAGEQGTFLLSPKSASFAVSNPTLDQLAMDALKQRNFKPTQMVKIR